MWRYVAGAAACFLFMTGVALLWQGRAQEVEPLPAAPPPRVATPSMVVAPQADDPPEATPRSREEKRFGRADRDKDGRVEREEMLGPRRKAFAKLDRNGNGTLSFDEWAVKTLDKFGRADRDRSGFLDPAEFATTAPKPARRKARCAC